MTQRWELWGVDASAQLTNHGLRWVWTSGRHTHVLTCWEMSSWTFLLTQLIPDMKLHPDAAAASGSSWRSTGVLLVLLWLVDSVLDHSWYRWLWLALFPYYFLITSSVWTYTVCLNSGVNVSFDVTLVQNSSSNIKLSALKSLIQFIRKNWSIMKWWGRGLSCSSATFTVNQIFFLSDVFRFDVWCLSL